MVGCIVALKLDVLFTLVFLFVQIIINTMLNKKAYCLPEK